MLDRLQELQAAAGSPGESATSEALLPAAASVQELLANEAAFWKVHAEARAQIDSLRRSLGSLQKEFLPRRLQALNSDFEQKDAACQNLLCRAKALLTKLRSTGQGEEESGAVPRIREGLAKHAASELGALMRTYVDVSNEHNLATEERLRRQLRLSYPEASPHELEGVLEYPKLAERALARRLERDASFTEVLAELDGEYGDALRLEDSASQLKMLFFQFSEMVDEQEVVLEQVEANVAQVAEDTVSAVHVLHQAAELKHRSDRQRILLWLMVACAVVLLLLLWNSSFFLTQLVDLAKYVNGPKPARMSFTEIGSTTTAEHEPRQFQPELRMVRTRAAKSVRAIALRPDGHMLH